MSHDFSPILSALSKASRARVEIEGTRDTFRVTWDGAAVFEVAHGRDVLACRIPEGEGASLALRRVIETIARVYGFGLSCNLDPCKASGRGPAYLHLAGHGSFRMLPGLWLVWSRHAPERTRPGTSDSFGLDMALDDMARTFPPRPIIASSRVA